MSERLVEPSIRMPDGRQYGVVLDKTGTGIDRYVEVTPEGNSQPTNSPEITSIANPGEIKLGRRQPHGSPESNLPLSS